MSLRLLILHYSRSSFHRPILPALLSFPNSHLSSRSLHYSNNPANRSYISYLKTTHNTPHTLRFTNRSITYGQYQFNYPQTGEGIIQELEPVHAHGSWSIEDIKELFQEQNDEVETRRVEAEFRKQTDQMVNQVRKLYPGRIEKRQGDDRRGVGAMGKRREGVSVDDIRKMSEEKFKVFKKTINGGEKERERERDRERWGRGEKEYGRDRDNREGESDRQFGGRN